MGKVAVQKHLGSAAVGESWHLLYLETAHFYCISSLHSYSVNMNSHLEIMVCALYVFLEQGTGGKCLISLEDINPLFLTLVLHLSPDLYQSMSGW